MLTNTLAIFFCRWVRFSLSCYLGNGFTNLVRQCPREPASRSGTCSFFASRCGQFCLSLAAGAPVSRDPLAARPARCFVPVHCGASTSQTGQMLPHKHPHSGKRIENSVWIIAGANNLEIFCNISFLPLILRPFPKRKRARIAFRAGSLCHCFRLCPSSRQVHCATTGGHEAKEYTVARNSNPGNGPTGLFAPSPGDRHRSSAGFPSSKATRCTHGRYNADGSG